MTREVHRRTFLGAAAAAAACSRRKVSYSGNVFIANFDGRAVAVVDLAAFAVVRHIALDEPPRLMITHPSQPYVYAAAGAQLVQIDPVRLEVVKALRLAAPATELAFSPDGDKLYTLTPGARGIGHLNAADLTGLARIELAAEPGRFAFTSDGSHAAVTLPSRGGIALIDLAQRRVSTRAAIGGQPWTVRFRSDGRVLVAGDRAGRTAVIVDLATAPQVAVRIPLGLDPLQMRENADGGQMFFAGPGSDSVVTLYPYRTEIGSTTLAGRAPGAMVLSRQPEYLFVANPPTSTVTILNIATQRVMGVVDVGREPVHLSVTPDGEYALVLNRASGDMSVLHIPTLAGRRNKAVALFTQVPVGSGPVSAAVRLG